VLQAVISKSTHNSEKSWGARRSNSR